MQFAVFGKLVIDSEERIEREFFRDRLSKRSGKQLEKNPPLVLVEFSVNSATFAVKRNLLTGAIVEATCDEEEVPAKKYDVLLAEKIGIKDDFLSLTRLQSHLFFFGENRCLLAWENRLQHELINLMLADHSTYQQLVGPADVVVVKPNIGWDRTPEQGANTHPDVVAEVVRLCREARARRVIVSDCPVRDPARAFERSGILAGGVGRRRGGDRRPRSIEPHIGGRDAPSVSAPGTSSSRSSIATKLINVPVAKHHDLAACTVGAQELDRHHRQAAPHVPRRPAALHRRARRPHAAHLDRR